MKRYDPSKPIIFVHVPKCAGTSFIKLLKNWYGDEYHHPHVDESQRGTTLPRLNLKDEDGRWRTDIGCIHGHFDAGRGYGLPDYYGELDQYFTILRDPFDIVVSMYFFAKEKSAKGQFLYDGEQIDIRDQYAGIEDYVKDDPSWLYNHLPQNISLDNYRETIAEKFVYIGIFEDLQRSVDELAKVLGKQPMRLTWANRSTYDEPIPDSLRIWFYDNHPLLKNVYDFAVEHYRPVALKRSILSRPLGAPVAVKRLLTTMMGRS